MAVKPASTIFRDWVTPGNSSSGANQPVKRDIREWAAAIEAGVGSREPDVWVQDQKAAGTEGGTFTSGAQRTRTLNTEVRNIIEGASLSSNVVTLPQGIWYIEFNALAYEVDSHQTRLYDITSAVALAVGAPARAGSAVDVATESKGSHLATLTGPTQLRLEHICTTTKTTTGLGRAANLGGIEQYAELRAWKVGDDLTIGDALNGGAEILSYLFSASIIVGDPGNGLLRLNNSTQRSSTAIYLDTVSADGVDVSSEINSLDLSTSDTKGIIRLVKQNDPSIRLLFRVTAVTEFSGYRRLTVVPHGHSEDSPFAEGDAVFLVYSRTGDKGDTGDTGATGATGATGQSLGINDLGPFRGEWDSGTAYAQGDIVRHLDVLYAAKQGANTNHNPLTDAPLPAGNGTWWYRATMPGKNVTITVGRAGTLGARDADYVCDGTADQVQINAAMADVSARGGGVVLVLAGSYSVSQSIVSTYNNVHLIAEKGVKIIAAVGFAHVVLPADPTGNTKGIIAFIGVDRFSCIGFEVDGRTNNILTNGIVAITTHNNVIGTPCKNFMIADNLVKLKVDHTYSIWSTRGQHGKIINNTIEGGYTDFSVGTYGFESQEGIELFGCLDVLIQGNTCRNLSGNGINLVSLANTSVDPLPATAIPDCAIENARVIGNYTDFCSAGISFTSSWDETVGPQGIKSAIIADNQCRRCGLFGLLGVALSFQPLLTTEAENDPIWIRDLDIHNNVFEMAEAADSPLTTGQVFALQNQLGSGLRCRGISIVGNKIMDSVHVGMNGALSILSFSDFDLALNQIITPEPGAGCKLAFINGSHNFKASSNTFDGADFQAIYLEDCQDYQFSGNLILNWNLSGVGYAGIASINSKNFEHRNNRFRTSNVTGLAALINMSGTCDEGFYSDNSYIGSGYTGLIEWENTGGAGTFNRNRPKGYVSTFTGAADKQKVVLLDAAGKIPIAFLP